MKKDISKIAQLLKKQKHAVKKRMPSSISPMLATLTHDYFYSPDWIYERKLDGERCIAFKKGARVSLKSRNNKLINNSYPEIKDAIAQLSALNEVIFDGEVVAFEGNLTSFSRLQPRMQRKNPNAKKRVAVYYYIFDLLYVNGHSVVKVPLIERKRILKELFRYKKPLRYCTYTFASSEQQFKAACKKGWEGLMVKDAQSTYVFKRSSSWLKFKCVAEQELVIGGFTDPGGSRIGFGAILVGYYKNGKFHYAGKVGTGFDDETLRYLRKQFDRITTKKCPFVNFDGSDRTVHWLKPQLVCEVGFTEWTKDNKLRHPRYLGLRRDKSAKKVVQEL